MNARSVLIAAALVTLSSRVGWSDDWPAERHDVRRSGISTQHLTAPLVEAWQTQTAKPSPAWPPPHFILLNRMDFDYAPQPVIAKQIVCLSSTADDTVRAFDLGTGEQLWRFVTGGPVRLAPQIDDGRVYFGSDDGCVYCTDLETGSLIWRVNAAPHEERFIGNCRMISRWPIRTGVLVTDGVAYFVAGMWATEGVFAYAVDAATGKTIWCNDTCGYAGVNYNHLLTLENVSEMRHGVHDGDFGVYGLTPQGALAVTSDVLLVPNGYNSPAGLDRKTGRLLFAEPQAGTGGTWLRAEDDLFYSVYQHRNRRILMTKRDPRTGERLHVHHLGIMNVTTEPNPNPYQQRAVGKTSILMVDGRAISKNAYSMVLAGDTLLLGLDGHVVARDRATDDELWRGAVHGRAYGLAVADGRVIATTDRGTIHCFAPKALPARHTPGRSVAESAGVAGVARLREFVGEGPNSGESGYESSSAIPDEKLIELVNDVGMDRGYALVLGDPSGQLSEAIVKQTSLRVVNCVRDSTAATKLRDRLIDTTSLYGERLHVPFIEAHTPQALPFAQHFANAVIVSNKTAATGQELFRVLRPCGGALIFAGHGTIEADRVLSELAEQLKNREAILRKDDQSVVITRGQLPGALDWDSENLTDQRARWPLRPLWFGGPSSAQVTDYKNTNARPPAAYGRYFVLGEDTLTAVDAYNGFVLWTRRVPKRAPDIKRVDGLLHYTDQVWSRELRDAHRRSVRADDRHVYLYLGEGEFRGEAAGCIVLDARTGRQEQVYAPFNNPVNVTLNRSQAWPLEIDANHSGLLTMAQSDTGLTITLETTDPVPTPLDQWELFFDFRPDNERFGLYERSVFSIHITPPLDAQTAAILETGVGDGHPELQVTGNRTTTGSRITVEMTWDEIVGLTGRRPDSFGFGAILNSHDGGADERIGQGTVFCDLSARGINNGWANMHLNSAPEVQSRPAIIAGSLAELPKVQINRIWPASIDQQVGEQLRIHPLTGEPGPRIFRSGTGTCGGFDFSATSVVKRSGAAKVLGVYDFADDSGLRTFIGVSAGCNATTTTALGMMIVSEAKARCVCTYPFRTTVALAPDQRRLQEDWAIFYDRDVDTRVRQAHINLGAFGDRRDSSGNLWLAFPRPVDRSQALGYPKLPGSKLEAYLPGIWPVGRSATMQVPLEVEFSPGGGPYRFNADRNRVRGTDRPWTYTSGYRGIRRATLKLNFFPRLATQSLTQAPAVDGHLSENEWPNQPQLTLPGTKTDIYFAHDDVNLYVAAQRPAHLDRRGRTLWKGETSGEDAEVWNDTSWELFIGDAVSSRVVHVGVSITGARYDAISQRGGAKPEQPEWNGVWQSGVSANDETGVVEMAIPWKTIESAGIDANQLAINFMVNRDARTGEAITYPGAKGRAGCLNLTPLGQQKAPRIEPRELRVRLHFAQPPDQPAARPFHVRLQGKLAASGIDISRVDRVPTAIVHDFRHVSASDFLTIEFIPVDPTQGADGTPILCAIECKEES